MGLDNAPAAGYLLSMRKVSHMLPKAVFLLVLLGFLFPMKAPASMAKGKMCCKGTCWMKAAPVKVSGERHGKRMISCCQKNCAGVSDRRAVPPSIQTQSKVIAKTLNSGDALLSQLSPPEAGSGRLYFPLHFPLNRNGTSRPLFQVHSVYLI